MDVQQIANWWDTMDAAERRHVKFQANVEAHSSTPWAVLGDLDKTRLMMHVEFGVGPAIACIVDLGIKAMEEAINTGRFQKHSGDLIGQLTAAVARHESRRP